MTVGLIDRLVAFLAILIPGMVLVLLSLAVAGWYYAWTVGAAVAATLGAAGYWSGRFPDRGIESPPVKSLVAIGIVLLGFTALNVGFAGEYFLTERDQGTYLATANWVVRHGDLLVVGPDSVFPSSPEISAEWNTFYPDRDDGRLYAQFAHGYPALAGSAGFVGGTQAILWVNPVLGSLALLIVFVLVSQIVGWVGATAITVLIAANLSFFVFVRDSFSEPLTLLLILLGITAAWAAHQSSSGVALNAAALAFGASTGVRIDSWLFVAGWFLVLTSWLVGPSRPQLGAKQLVTAAGVTLAASAVGFVDLWQRSPVYVTERLGSVIPMGIAGAAAISMFWISYGFRARLRPAVQDRWSPRSVQRLQMATSGTIVVSAVGLLFVRPSFFKVFGSFNQWMVDMQLLVGEPNLDGTVKLIENSALWFTWYWGWPAVVVTVAGLVVLGWGSLKQWTPAGLAMVLVAVPLVGFLLKPSISPDHIWAMRRFLVAGSVVVVVGLGVAAAWMRTFFETHDVSVAIRLALFAAIGLSLLTGSVTVAAGSYDYAAHKPMLATMDELCSSLPADAAVLTVGWQLGRNYSAAVRTYCDVPVARWEPDPGGISLDEIANFVAVGGYSLVVLSDGTLDPLGVPIGSNDVRTQWLAATLHASPSNRVEVRFTYLLETVHGN